MAVSTTFGSRVAAVLTAALIVAVAPPVFAKNGDGSLWESTGAGSPGAVRHMPETIRSSVRNVVVVSTAGGTDEKVDGTYGQATPGLAGGIAEGSDMATITREVGGVTVDIPIPGMQIPAAILGGLSGVTRQEIQELRDAMTQSLMESERPPLRSDGLSLDAYWSLRRLPHMEAHLYSPARAIPADADAILQTRFGELTIDVDGDDAVITTSAVAILRSAADGLALYGTRVSYQDRDTLKNWTADDNALWQSYTQFARHYLGQEIAAELFGRVEPTHTLVPIDTVSAKVARDDPARVTTKSATPELAWSLELAADDRYGPWTREITGEQITWDIEIFDDRRLVYDAKDLSAARHTPTVPLEPCRTYRWSVRPLYHVGGEARFGEWMRFEPPTPEDEASREALAEARNSFGKGLIGRKASDAQAYLQDFAELEVSCRR